MYLLTSQCVPYYLFRVSPLCTPKLDTPSLTRRSSFRRVQCETQLEVLLLALLVIYAVRTYTPSLELVLYTTWQFPYTPSGAGNLTTYIMTARLSDRDLALALERTPFKGQVVHDRSLAIERFPQTALHAKHLMSSADTRQRAKVNPTTITTPFRSQSRNPDHHPSRTL